jgi:hypothetical protein
MRLIQFLIITLFVNTTCLAQNDKMCYIYFDTAKNKILYKLKDQKPITYQKYAKSKQDDGAIIFKIDDNAYYFEYYSNNNVKKIDKSEFDKIEFSTLNNLSEAYRKSGLFSTRNVFDSIYLVVPIRDKKYEIYKVDWINVVE